MQTVKNLFTLYELVVKYFQPFMLEDVVLYVTCKSPIVQ